MLCHLGSCLFLLFALQIFNVMVVLVCGGCGGGDGSGVVVGGGVVGKTGTMQYKELGVLGGSAANWGCFAGLSR